jgi:hypothetical protein
MALHVITLRAVLRVPYLLQVLLQDLEPSWERRSRIGELIMLLAVGLELHRLVVHGDPLAPWGTLDRCHCIG